MPYGTFQVKFCFTPAAITDSIVRYWRCLFSGSDIMDIRSLTHVPTIQLRDICPIS